MTLTGTLQTPPHQYSKDALPLKKVLVIMWMVVIIIIMIIMKMIDEDDEEVYGDMKTDYSLFQ